MTEAVLARRLSSERRPYSASAILVFNWVCILTVFWLLGHDPSWPMFAFGFAFLAVEQHCLGLWMHEGGHFLIATSRTVNDVLVIVFLSGPLYVPLNAYRRRHLLHHGHLGTERDTKPVIFTRIDGPNLVRFFVKTCLGLQLAQIATEYFWSPRGSSTTEERSNWLPDVLPVVAVQALLFVFIATVAPWHFYLWFWVLPWLTINRFVAGLRSVVEHQPMRGESHPFVRPLKPTVVDRLIFCRAGFNYHWLHHRYPNVPCFNLRKLDTAVDADAESRLSYTAALRLLIEGGSGNASPS